MNTSRNESNLVFTDHDDALIDEIDDALLRFGRGISSYHSRALECPETLSMAQTMLLRSIEQQGSVKMSEVASLLMIKAPAASAVIAGLERNGLVERSVDEGDRRVTLVTLTPKGLKALHDFETHRRKHMRRFLSVLTPEEIRSMIAIQNKLIEALTSNQI